MLLVFVEIQASSVKPAACCAPTILFLFQSLSPSLLFIYVHHQPVQKTQQQLRVRQKKKKTRNNYFMTYALQ